MKEYLDRGGRLPYRLWYEETEIEALCERELELAGWPCLPDRPATDVDAFIEGRLGLSPDFAWLPAGVLGATEFSAKGHMRLQVSAELSVKAESDPSAERLVRSTLAHEAAHILLHRTLFLTESRALFSGISERTELCRTVGVTSPGYSGEWWEWQANRGMAVLLLPRPRLTDWLAAWRRIHPGASVTAMRTAAADAFEVSADAIKRRLAQLDALALLA